MAEKSPMWHEVKAELERRLAVTKAKLVRANTDRDVWQLQGRALQLEELLNLPATVEILEQKGNQHGRG